MTSRPIQASPEWHVFVLPSIHQDISYMKTAEEDLQLFTDEYLKYLDLMDSEPTWCYSSEYAFAVRHFLNIHPEERERLTRYVRDGRFGITAQCSGFDPSFYTGELVIREIADAKKWLSDTFGYEPRTIHIADCPDFMPQLSQILAGCGVDLFLCDRAGSGEGNRGNVLHIAEYPGMWERIDNEILQITVRRMGFNKELGELDALYPGYWEWKRDHRNDQPISRLWYHVGLDGSRVLAYAPSQRYHGFCGLERIPGEKPESHLYNEEVFLSNLDAAVEPAFTALGIVGFDERAINAAQVVENVARWNRSTREDRGIKLEIATAEQFTSRVHALVRSGEFKPGEYSGITPGWNFGTVDSDDMAFVQNQLPNAEMLASLGAMLGAGPYPSQRIERAWDVLWAISHNQKGDPSYFRALRDSRKRTEELLTASLSTLTAAIQPARGSRPILVFNGLSWERSERVRIEISGEASAIVDADGHVMPSVTLSRKAKPDGTTTSEVEFIARRVPGIGYRTFYAEEGGRSSSDLDVGDNWIQNRYFRVEVDAKNRLRVTNRLTGRGLPAGTSDYGAFRLAGQGLQGELAWQTERVITASDDVKATLIVHGMIGRAPASLRLIVADGTPRVDLEVDLDWDGQRGTQIYFPLPFHFSPDELRLGVSCGHVPYYRPTAPAILRNAPLSKKSAPTTFSTFWYFPRSHEPIPGDDFSWAYMQKWMYLGPESGHVAFASGRRNGIVVGDGVLAIPLLSTPAGRAKHVRRRNIYATGHHHWAFAFAVAPDSAAAPNLGWALAQPLLGSARWQDGGRLGDTARVIELSPQAAIPMALKRSYDDDGWVLRFYESTDSDQSIRLKTHTALGLQSAGLYAADMLDHPVEDLEWMAGQAQVALEGFEIKTLLFRDPPPA